MSSSGESLVEGASCAFRRAAPAVALVAGFAVFGVAAEPGAMSEANSSVVTQRLGTATNMSASITVEHQPSRESLQRRGVLQWDIWTCDVSEFPWHYGSRETCYFLEGEVVVTPKGGKPVTMGKGDLVTFPAGMDCTWKVLKAVRKHYVFE